MTESRDFSFNFILYEYLQLLPLLPFEQTSVASHSKQELVILLSHHASSVSC